MVKYIQCLLVLLLPSTAVGQAITADKPELQVESKPAVNADLAGQLQLVEAATDLDETAKAKAVDAYKQAIAAADAAETFRGSANDFAARTTAIAADAKELQARLAEPTPRPTVDRTTPLKDLDSAVQQKAAALETLRQEVATHNDAITARDKRLLAIPKAIAEAQSRLSEVEKQLTAAATPGEHPTVTKARSTLTEQRRRAIQNEIESLKLENAWELANGELLPLRRDVAKKRQDALQGELALWQQAAQEKRETEVDRDVRAAETFFSKAPASLIPLATMNKETAIARRETEAQLRDTTAQQADLQAIAETLQKQFDRAKAEAGAQVTITQTFGEVLRDKRSELRAYQLLLPNTKELQQEVSRTRVKLFQLREEEEQFDDVEERTRELATSLNVPEALLDSLREQVTFRKSLLTGLRTDMEALFQGLAKLEGTDVGLSSLCLRYATFIDERVLWIRSAALFGPAHLKNALEAGRLLVAPSQWTSLPAELTAHLRQRPLLPLIGGLMLIPLFYFGFRLRRGIRECGEKAESGSCRDFGITLRASLLTAAISIAWPALLYLVGVWLRGDFRGDIRLVRPLSAGFIGSAIVLLPLEFFRQSARPYGLMTSHFGVSKRVVAIIRSNLRWLILTLVPLVGIASAIRFAGNPVYEQSVGRIAFVLAILTFGVFIYRVAHPKRGAPQEYLARRGTTFIYKSRWFWFSLLLAVPIAFATLSLAGYQFTAVQLATRLLWTSFLLLGLWILHALALRWVVLSRRRLAIEQARARLAKASEQTETGPGTVEAQANLEEIDLTSVNQQTRRLVRAITVVAGTLALWSLWVDVLPALARFDEIKAWEVSVPAAIPAAAANADAPATAVNTIKEVSYADIAVAIAIFVAMLLAMRDVPGLLELILLQRLPLDVALRFAISTLTRYAIFVVGTAWALSTIEIGWSKVQWLVAGVSVGLGFGLQEIFANFVSGLIILFERPLRAGDIVTIDGVTGTVKSIRMRATIISDLDRKDFIVPNKDFITGRLLNWTLSDEVSRVVIPVGIAYGSDTDKAKALILAAATEHEQIVAEPGPQVTFEGFGDSSLNLVLRCFISLQNMPSRLKIIDQLHTTIDKSFRKASIEIPFPQRDLHLRSSNGCGLDAACGLPAKEVTQDGT